MQQYSVNEGLKGNDAEGTIKWALKNRKWSNTEVSGKLMGREDYF